MKSNSIKLIAIFILTISLALQNFAQSTVKCTEQCCKTAVKIDEDLIPKTVTDQYIDEYPVATYQSWYGYPMFAFVSDWYGYNRNLFCEENPEYYVVEFTKDTTPHKVIYSKTGEKIATHKTVNTIPKAILLAIKKTVYSTWKLGKGREEVFKDGDNDDLKIYKITVEKGKEKHILFFQLNGILLKDKEIKS